MDQENRSSGIVFDNEESQRSRHPVQTSSPAMVRWIIRNSGGLVKSEGQANFVLLGLVAVVVIFSFSLIMGGRENSSAEIQKKYQGVIHLLPQQ